MEKFQEVTIEPRHKSQSPQTGQVYFNSTYI
jgi:hypothetical protein